MVYLQHLFENMEEVNWSKVPYGGAVKRYLECVKHIQESSKSLELEHRTSTDKKDKKVTKVVLNEG